MKSISIRELHLETGRWVRRAGSGSALLVMDRGRPIATLSPYDARKLRKRLPNREAEIRRLPRLPGDTAQYISEDRDRS